MLARPRLRPVVSPLVIAAALAALAARGQAETRVIVHGNGRPLGITPLIVDAPAGLESGRYTAKPTGGQGQAIAAACQELGGKSKLVMILPEVPAEGAVTYSLTKASQGASATDVRIEAVPDSRDLKVVLSGKPFTTMRFGEESKPYLYPVLGPGGKPYTRAYPIESAEGEDRDHPHQRSFWFTHGIVNGYDFWASDPLNGKNPKFGTIRATAIDSDSNDRGGLAARVRTDDEWLGPDGKPVCTDERVFTFYGSDSPRIIDVDLTVKATHGPVTFGETKEGAFGLRVASSMDVKRKQGGRITNAEGITDTAAWGKASPWVDYTGPIAGETVGVAILNHPSSFRYPTTWHVRDYGLFAANPFGYKDFGMKEPGEHTIPQGGSMRLGYRVILHEGDTEAAHIPAAFAAYAEAPKVEVQTD